MTKKTVAVVGGGVSGMTAALVLARFGHEVTLVERSPVLGNTVRGFFREGVYFDIGLHYTGGLGEKGPLRRYLRFLGLGDLPVQAFPPDGFDTIRFVDEKREIPLCVGYEAMKQRLHSLFPTEGRAIDEYFSEVRAIYDSSPFTFGEDADISSLFAEEVYSDTLAAFLIKRTKDPVLCATLAIHTLLHGSPPGEVSFLQHARIASAYFDSVHTFVGSGRALAEGFERRLAEEGVRVILGAAVTHINFTPLGQDKGDIIAGVTLADGSMLDADAVVYTAHPFFLPDIVPQRQLRPTLAHRLRSLEETPSAYMLFGVCDPASPPFRGGNLFLCPDADLSAFFDPKRDAAAGPFYVTTSPTVEDGAPGRGVIAIAPGDFSECAPWKDTLSGDRGPEYAAFKAEKLERFRTALLAACPELASVRFVDGATPLTFRDFTHSPTGSLYGRKHSLTQYSPLPVTRVPGLWLAGQSVTAPGVLGAVISAFLACGFIVGQGALHEALCADGYSVLP